MALVYVNYKMEAVQSPTMTKRDKTEDCQLEREYWYIVVNTG